MQRSGTHEDDPVLSEDSGGVVVEQPSRTVGQRVRLRDVAAAAGVSEGQASAALSGYRRVSDATRQRVREAATRLGYHPSEHARLLAGRRAIGSGGTVQARRCAVVLETVPITQGDPARVIQGFTGEMINGVLWRASELGMDLRLVPTTTDLSATLSQLLARDGADAVVIHSFADLRPDQLRPLHDAGCPYVLMNRHFDGDPPVPAVVPDVRTGAGDAVDLLVSLGHRRLALVVGDRSTSVVRDYCAGWQSAAERHGIADTVQILRPRHDDARAVRAAVAPLLRDADRPTAIVAVAAGTAHEIMTHARQIGLEIPRDLSLITFQDSFARFTTPTLTAFDLRLGEVGARTVDLVAAQLGLATPADTDVVPGTRWVPVPLVVRESTAPPPS